MFKFTHGEVAKSPPAVINETASKRHRWASNRLRGRAPLMKFYRKEAVYHDTHRSPNNFFSDMPACIFRVFIFSVQQFTMVLARIATILPETSVLSLSTLHVIQLDQCAQQWTRSQPRWVLVCATLRPWQVTWGLMQTLMGELSPTLIGPHFQFSPNFYVLSYVCAASRLPTTKINAVARGESEVDFCNAVPM